MKKIPLRNKHKEIVGWALVDDADFDWLNKYSWRVIQNGKEKNKYARTDLPVSEGGKSVRMHRLIMGAVDQTEVDHHDNNGFNNQRFNLRIATHSQNSFNREKITRKTSSKFKGVRKGRARWEARITVEGNKKSLGSFENEIDAARAYDDAAKKLFGNFAKLNFPD